MPGVQVGTAAVEVKREGSGKRPETLGERGNLVAFEGPQDASRFPVWGSFMQRQGKRGGTSLEGSHAELEVPADTPGEMDVHNMHVFGVSHLSAAPSQLGGLGHALRALECKVRRSASHIPLHWGLRFLPEPRGRDRLMALVASFLPEAQVLSAQLAEALGAPATPCSPSWHLPGNRSTTNPSLSCGSLACHPSSSLPGLSRLPAQVPSPFPPPNFLLLLFP